MARFTGNASKTLEATNEQKQKVADLEAWKNQGTDNYYMQQIEKYRGTEWYDKLVNNPYLRANNAPYSKNFLQDIAYGLFGDTSAEDEYYGNLQNMRNQYLAETLEAMRQQEHNSPEAEVARRRAAGLNDDLNGGQAIGTGQAAENDQPMQTPPGMGGQQTSIQDKLNGLWNVFTQAYALTMGFVQDSQAVRAAQIANEGNELENAEKVMNVATGAYNFGRKYGSDGKYPVESFASTFKPIFKTSKGFKRFNEMFYFGLGNVENELKNLGYDTQIREAKMQNVWTRGKEQAYGMEVGGDILREWSMNWHKMEKEFEQINMRVQKKMAKNREKYENVKDYGQVATLENKQTGSALAKFEMEKTLNSFMSTFTDRLNEMAKEKGLKGFGASVMLGFMAMQHMGMMPSLNLPNLNFSKPNNTFVTNNDNQFEKMVNIR